MQINDGAHSLSRVLEKEVKETRILHFSLFIYFYEPWQSRISFSSSNVIFPSPSALNQNIPVLFLSSEYVIVLLARLKYSKVCLSNDFGGQGFMVGIFWQISSPFLWMKLDCSSTLVVKQIPPHSFWTDRKSSRQRNPHTLPSLPLNTCLKRDKESYDWV